MLTVATMAKNSPNLVTLSTYICMNLKNKQIGICFDINTSLC
jgi:hypothetical protein